MVPHCLISGYDVYSVPVLSLGPRTGQNPCRVLALYQELQRTNNFTHHSRVHLIFYEAENTRKRPTLWRIDHESVCGCVRECEV